MRKQTILFVCLLLCVTAGCFAQPKQVAILDIVDRKGDFDDFDKMMMKGKFTKAINSAEGYEAYNRTDIGAITREWNFQSSGMVNDSQIREFGNLTGAAYILKVEMAMKQDGSTRYAGVIAEIISVETAQVVGSAVDKAVYNVDEWDALAKRLVMQLLGSTPTGNRICSGCSEHLGDLELWSRDLGAFDWEQAMGACPAGWRLPTKLELRAIHQSKDKSGMPSTGTYWSCTSDAPDSAWALNFATGNQANFGKSFVFKARCVREVQ